MARRAVWRRRLLPKRRRSRRRRRRRRKRPRRRKRLPRRSSRRSGRAVGVLDAKRSVALVGEVEGQHAEGSCDTPRRQKPTTEGVGETEVRVSRDLASEGDLKRFGL